MKEFVSRLIYKQSKTKYIIFESNPDFSDNTYPVFEEMVNRGLNKKYKFLWQLSDKGFDTSVFLLV